MSNELVCLASCRGCAIVVAVLVRAPDQLDRNEFSTFGRGAVSSSTISPVVGLVVDTASLVFRQTVREEDSLFDLGVDSLSVIEYCRQLEEQLGVDVEVEELFAAESLAAFGTLLAPRVAARK